MTQHRHITAVSRLTLLLLSLFCSEGRALSRTFAFAASERKTRCLHHRGMVENTAGTSRYGHWVVHNPVGRRPTVLMLKTMTFGSPSSIRSLFGGRRSLKVFLSDDDDDDTPVGESSRGSDEQPAATVSVLRFKFIELVGVVIWLTALSSFILVNRFVGPWPQELITAVPGNIWLVLHYLGGMLFAGGIIMTTCIEWFVASTKNSPVLLIWFRQVPVLDAFIVLPGLTLAMVAGTGLSIDHYGSLERTPAHIETTFWTLVAFAVWWALTDLTTQSRAAKAIEEWAAAASNSNEKDVPSIVQFRRISNAVSCMFIIALYGIMTLKPGLMHYYHAWTYALLLDSPII